MIFSTYSSTILMQHSNRIQAKKGRVSREWHETGNIIIIIFVMMVNLDSASTSSSVGIGLEDLLHVNNNNEKEDQKSPEIAINITEKVNQALLFNSKVAWLGKLLRAESLIFVSTLLNRLSGQEQTCVESGCSFFHGSVKKCLSAGINVKKLGLGISNEGKIFAK